MATAATSTAAASDGGFSVQSVLQAAGAEAGEWVLVVTGAGSQGFTTLRKGGCKYYGPHEHFQVDAACDRAAVEHRCTR